MILVKTILFKPDRLTEVMTLKIFKCAYLDSEKVQGYFITDKVLLILSSRLSDEFNCIYGDSVRQGRFVANLIKMTFQEFINKFYFKNEKLCLQHTMK